MLRGGWGQGDALAAAGARGLVQSIGGAGGRGGNRREGGVTGYTCEGGVDACWLWGTRRAWVREREVSVAHVGQVVVLVVGQEGGRVVLVVKRRPWETKTK